MPSLLSFLRRSNRREIHGRELSSSHSAPPLPGTIKEDLLPGAHKRWFEAFVAPFTESGRTSRLGTIIGIIAILEGIALTQLIPLHKPMPYLAEFDEEDGKLREVGKFKPLTEENIKQREIDYHLKKWARWVLTIDSQTKSNLEKAGPWARGAGSNELNEWVDKRDRPGERQARDPDYTRTFEKKIAVSYGQGKTVFFHIELIERRQGVEIGRLKKLMQIDYEMVSEQFSDENPLGLAIIHFTIGDE